MHQPNQIRTRTAPFLLICALSALPAVLPTTSAAAQEDVETRIESLRQQMEALRDDYEQRILRLEERIAELESAAPPPQEGDLDETARLRAAARASAEGADAAGAVARPGGRESTPGAPGRQRNLNRLNPEISATGIVSGVASDLEREEFERGEFELDLQATLDPFSSMRWTIAFSEEGEVEIEEGYLAYTALPGGLKLLAGRFRQRFGALNRQHLHALPQTAYPLALTRIFGEEGLGQTGVSASWLLPRAWATANEVTVELTDGENDFFGGESFDDLALLAHVKSFWEVSPSTYLDWGLSGMTGRTEISGNARVFGTDLTYHWQPPRRAKYREVTWRTELFLAQRDDPSGLEQETWSGYTYLEGLVARNLYAGARYDWSEDPFAPETETWAVVPYLTWWQSEWVRLRAEYEYRRDDGLDTSENRFTLQLTWAAGPHKHETY